MFTKNNSTNDLISELNKIEEDRVKSQEKEKQLALKIKLQEEADNLKKMLAEQEIERKRLEEEELIKKQNELIKEKIEKLKTENINVNIEGIPHNIDNFTKANDVLNVEVTCKNNKLNYKNNNSRFILAGLFSLFVGVVISLSVYTHLNQDDGIVLKLEHPKIMLLTEVIEKEIIIEKEVKQVTSTKPQTTKQVTNTKPQQNTPTVTKPKSKCPVSDPLCGIF